MIMALALPVVLLAIGGAIDFSRMTQLRKEMQDAADIASLGAIAPNSIAYKAKVKGDDDFASAGGEKQARAIFFSNMSGSNELSMFKVAAQFSQTDTTLTTAVLVKARYRPYILGLMGKAYFPISVTSTSTSTMAPYMDFYLLLDNSPSMGLGATYADIDKLMVATTGKSEGTCAFACHESGANAGNDYYTIAKKAGVTMRIDVVRLATQNLMTTAKKTQSKTGQFRMAIYNFGLAADQIDQKSPPAYQISALTTDLDASAKNAAAIDLMTIPYQNYNSDRQTNFKSVFSSMNALISAAGDGTSAKKPQKVLFFVSDGATDSYDCSASGCRRLGPLDVTTCKAMKNRGIKVAVLYTKYLRLVDKYKNQWYIDNMDKYVSPTEQLSAEMKACASDGLFFEVGPNQGISEAMAALFAKVVTSVRINS